MERILVTGGSGFIGSSIVKRLAKARKYVRVFDNGFRSAKESLPSSPYINVIEGDIRDFDTVNKACRNIDIVIHLAYINGTKFFYEKPDLVLEVGIKGILNILDAAREQKVKDLYLASSSEVYQTPTIIPTPENVPYLIPDPLNPRYSYAGGKIISELMALHIGAKFLRKVVIFRPHNVYGPNMGTEHVIPELMSKIISLKKGASEIKLPVQGDGTQTRAFIYIEDFTDALMLLVLKGKNRNIYNIGTENEIAILDLISKLGEIAKIDISILKTSMPEGGTNRRCPDVSKLEKLGFKPKTPLDMGLKKTYQWYNEFLT